MQTEILFKQTAFFFYYFLDTPIYTVSSSIPILCVAFRAYRFARTIPNPALVVAPSLMSLFNVCEFVLIHAYFRNSIPICLAIKSKSNRNSSVCASKKRVHFVFLGSIRVCVCGVQYTHGGPPNYHFTQPMPYHTVYV